MRHIRTLSLLIASAVFCLALAGPSRAAPCGGDFDTWLADFKREAATQGISQSALGAALEGITVDPAVLSRDRGQRVFSQTFEQFSGRMISAHRMRRGGAMLARYASAFSPFNRHVRDPRPVQATAIRL